MTILERIWELLKANFWDERVTRLLTLIEGEFARLDWRRRSSGSAVLTWDEDGYADRCTVCGHTGYLHRRGQVIKGNS